MFCRKCNSSHVKGSFNQISDQFQKIILKLSKSSVIMTEYEEILSNTNNYQSDSSDDTDEELKEAFAAGLLKPGLNYMGEAPEKKVAKNNVTGLKQKLSELQRNLPWVRN